MKSGVLPPGPRTFSKLVLPCWLVACSFVVVRGLSIQRNFVGHLFWVRCVHVCVVVVRLTLIYVLMDTLDFVVILSV